MDEFCAIIPRDDWDGYWRHFQVLLDPPPPVETWQVAKGSELVVGQLRGFGCRRMLEAASGIGLKAITFRRLGLEVVGMDGSAAGVALSRQLSHAVGIDVDFHQLTWAEGPSKFAGEFDAVFNDQTMNSSTLDVMAEAARCAYATLRPGGVFLFGSRPIDEWEMPAGELVERHWQGAPACELAWVKDSSDGRLTAIWLRTRYRDGIYHRLVQLVDRPSGRSVESSGFFVSYRWRWEDCVRVLTAAGFKDVLQQQLEADPMHLARGVAVR